MASVAASVAEGVPAEPLRHNEIAQLAAQLASVAALVGGDRLLLTEGEANAIAQPLSRMLARHTPAQRMIRRYTDPVVLLAVAAAIARVRLGRRSGPSGVVVPPGRAPSQQPSAPGPTPAPAAPSPAAAAAAAAAAGADPIAAAAAARGGGYDPVANANLSAAIDAMASIP